MDNKAENNNIEQRIDAYIKGQLSDEEVQDLWMQLVKHPEYISLLQTELDLTRIYNQKAQSQNTTGHYWKWIASAAAVIVFIITLNILTTNDLQPLKSLGQTNINLVENLASAEVTRSGTALDPADSLLNTGFKAAISGQIETAIRIFEDIIVRYDSTRAVPKAYLNLGILKYNSGDFDGCIESFNQAISNARDDSLLIEQSYWYLGNAFVNTNELPKARDAVKKAFEMGETYKKEAFRLLKRLDYELGNIDFDNFEQQMKENE